ncbi:MAG: hypothetical protein PHX24_13445, partial [Acidithiobacillus sp.]|nr:hypothetical protein [Acidithiobacillus sp.]
HDPQEEIVETLARIRIGHQPLSHSVFRHIFTAPAFFRLRFYSFMAYIATEDAALTRCGPHFSIEGQAFRSQLQTLRSLACLIEHAG